jgi:hypothetical protein
MRQAPHPFGVWLAGAARGPVPKSSAWRRAMILSVLWTTAVLTSSSEASETKHGGGRPLGQSPLSNAIVKAWHDSTQGNHPIRIRFSRRVCPYPYFYVRAIGVELAYASIRQSEFYLLRSASTTAPTPTPAPAPTPAPTYTCRHPFLARESERFHGASSGATHLQSHDSLPMDQPNPNQ